MARNTGIVVTNDFSRGLFTEGTRLNIPDNTALEVFDVVINPDKTIVRRKGWEFEKLKTLHTIDRADAVVNGWTWANAAGDGTIDVYIQQVGGTLHFFKAADPYSGTKSTATITLSTFSPSGADVPDTVECQFTKGNGLVFVTHPFLESFFLTFTDINNIVATQINPQIRDLQGVISLGQDDSTEIGVDVRETAGIGDLNVNHKYNLFNQGWYFNTNAALTAWDTARTDMPSNADIWWAYNDSSGDWANAQVARVHLGNTFAARGHYILNIYNEDRDAASGLSTIPDVTTGTQRATTSVFFAGRWWMAGINHSRVSSNIYFTQVILDNTQYDRMYQQNDPTTELTPDLLASDGGIIPIPESGTVFKLWALAQAILVFAQNGIWAITGSLGIGFTANDFSVIKVSDICTTTAKTFVNVEGFPFWWNDEGIYSLTEKEGGGFQILNIIEDSIKTFFETIPVSSRRHAKGEYNPVLKTVQWLYQSAAQATVEDLQVYNKIMNFSLRDGSFIPWTVGTGNYKVHDVAVSTALNQAVTNVTIVADTGYSFTVTSDFGVDEKLDATAHGLLDTEVIRLTTDGTLPAGLSLLTDYFIINKTANDFEVSLTSGGGAVDITSDGSGTHTATLQDSPVIVGDSSVVTTDFATDDKWDWTATPLANNDEVRLITSAADLPSGFAIDTTYHVINKAANDFELSATSGGAAISPADDGTGTHTIFKWRVGDTVISTVVGGTAETSPGFKYIISKDNGASSDSFTFAETNDDVLWVDWTTEETTGVAYSSFLITGYSIRGDTMRKQQTPYVQTFMENVAGSGLILQGFWDWAANTTSGKQTTTQQCFSSKRTNFDVNTRRLKLRGTGKALQLKFSSEAGKPFTLLGWAKSESVSGDV